MRWRGSYCREIADRRNRFIGPIRAGRSEWGTSTRLQRGRDEWTGLLQTEALQLAQPCLCLPPADRRPSCQTAPPCRHYRGNT